MRTLSVSLLFALMLAAPAHARRPQSATARSGGLYSAELYQEGRRALRQGDFAGALEDFCDMVPPGEETLWTVSVVLLCDPEEVPAAVEAIQDPQPVFVTKRVFEGRVCFRVCAGLTNLRQEAVAMRVRLPDSVKNAGPFPVEVPRPCDPSLPDALRPPKPPPPGAAPAPVQTHAPDSAAAATVGPGQPDILEMKPVPPEPAPAAPPPEGRGVSAASARPPSQPSPFATAPLTTGPGLPGSPPVGPQGSVPPPPSRNPQAEALFQRGVSAYNLGDRKLAESLYTQSLELSPDKPETLTNLGILYLEEKRVKEAKPLFEKAIERAPGYARAHLGMAGALWSSDDCAEALDEVRTAVRLDSHDVNARLTLASFLRAVGQEEEAMKEARLVLLMEPNNRTATDFVNTPPPKKTKKLKEKSAKDGEKGSQ